MIWRPVEIWPAHQRQDADLIVVLNTPMPFDPQSHQPVVFKNNAAVFFWLFIAAWMVIVIYITRSVLSGPDSSVFVVAFVTLFWVIGLAFTALALWAPRVRVEITRDGVFVREWAPLWKRHRQFAAGDLSVSSIVENKDSEDGGVHYSCSLLLPGKESIILVQGNARPKVAQERARLISALMTAERKGR
jgi:hypothetical protein